MYVLKEFPKENLYFHTRKNRTKTEGVWKGEDTFLPSEASGMYFCHLQFAFTLLLFNGSSLKLLLSLLHIDCGGGEMKNKKTLILSYF